MTSKRTSSKAFAGVKETEMKKRRPGRAKTKEEKAPGEPWTPENRVHTELVELAADTDIRVALPTLLNTLDNVSRAKTVEFIETPTNDTKDVLSRIAQLEFGPPASGCKGGRPPMDFSWIFFVLSVVVALGREEYLWEDIATYIYDMAMTPSELAQELAQEKERWEKKMRGEEVPPKASRKKNRPVPEGEERFVPDSPASATLRRYFG